MSEEQANPAAEEEKVVATAEAEAPEAPVKKEETAEDLLKSDLDGVKIRRAKGSKNITSGIVNVLATFNNTKVPSPTPAGMSFRPALASATPRPASPRGRAM